MLTKLKIVGFEIILFSSYCTLMKLGFRRGLNALRTVIIVILGFAFMH